MGYTHYWDMPDELMDEKVLEDVKRVLNKYEGVIQAEFNESGQPIVNKDVIKFNGVGDEAHETFYLGPAVQSGFCKTDGKPYDKAVCETLLVLKAHYGDKFNLESDGFFVSKENLKEEKLKGSWDEAIKNVERELGYKFNPVPKIEEGRYNISYFFDLTSIDTTNEKYHEGTWELLDSYYETMVETNISQNNYRNEVLSVKNNFDLHLRALRDVKTTHPDYTFEGEELDLYTKELWVGKKEVDLLKDVGVELYYYNGFSEPEKINGFEKLSVESNYLGDVTYDFLAEFNSRIEDVDIADLQKNQYVAEYGVWVNPTKDQLQAFNRSVMLDENEYLQDFEGSDDMSMNNDGRASSLKDRVSLKSSETIVDESIDVYFDRYTFEERRGLSTRDIDVVVDFENETIEGDMVAYGDWFDIEADECIEYLDTLDKRDVLHDFSEIREKYNHLRLKDLIHGVESYEKQLDIESDPKYHEVEVHDGANEVYIGHYIEDENIEVYFAESDFVKGLRSDAYAGNVSEDELIEEIGRLNDLEDHFNYDNVVGYSINGEQVRFLEGNKKDNSKDVER